MILVTAIAMLHYVSFNLGSLDVGNLKVNIDIGFILLAILLPIYTVVDTLTGVSNRDSSSNLVT